MNIAVVEDEQAAVDLLRKHVERYASERSITCDIAVFRDGADFLDRYHPIFDVIFMDIEMPHINGMETARRLRKTDTTVTLIFITSLKQYALDGYSVEALDYLVKPVGYVHFSTMMDRVQDRLQKRSDAEIVLTAGYAVHRLRCADIYYVEIVQHYVVYHTSAGEIKFWGTLSDEENRLPKDRFARPNSAYLVNLAHVQRVEKDTIYVDGSTISISRGKKARFMQALMRYLDGGQ